MCNFWKQKQKGAREGVLKGEPGINGDLSYVQDMNPTHSEKISPPLQAFPRQDAKFPTAQAFLSILPHNPHQPS